MVHLSLLNLNAVRVCRCSRVCREWSRYLEYDQLWGALVDRDCPVAQRERSERMQAAVAATRYSLSIDLTSQLEQDTCSDHLHKPVGVLVQVSYFCSHITEPGLLWCAVPVRDCPMQQDSHYGHRSAAALATRSASEQSCSIGCNTYVAYLSEVVSSIETSRRFTFVTTALLGDRMCHCCAAETTDMLEGGIQGLADDVSQPTFSPLGDRIAFSCSRGRRDFIQVVDLKTKERLSLPYVRVRPDCCTASRCVV